MLNAISKVVKFKRPGTESNLIPIPGIPKECNTSVLVRIIRETPSGKTIGTSIEE